MAALDLDLTVGLRSFALELKLALERETVALVGPSGSGKTTVLRAVAGLRRPDRGHVRAHGVPWFDRAARVDLPPEARSVGLVFQEYALFPHLTVRRNVAFGAARDVVPDAFLERFGIGHLAGARPDAISGGERQRVALARALARRPEVLLLDEPLAALDALTRRLVRDEIGAVLATESLPTLLVTHDFRDASALATRVGVMSAGRLRQIGTPAELIDHPADSFVAALTGSNLLPGVLGPDGVVVLDAGGRVSAGGSAASVDSASKEGTGRVGVAVHPWELSAGMGRPPAGDGVGVLTGVATGLALDGGRLRFRVGPVTAELPSDEAERLGIRAGEPAWVRVPPHAVRLVPLVDAPPDT